MGDRRTKPSVLGWMASVMKLTCHLPTLQNYGRGWNALFRPPAKRPEDALPAPRQQADAATTLRRYASGPGITATRSIAAAVSRLKSRKRTKRQMPRLLKF